MSVTRLHALRMDASDRPRAAPTARPSRAGPSKRAFPVVVEPDSTAGSASSLADELGRALGARVLGLLESHGAVLLRGWNVRSASELAIVAGALRRCGLTSMSDYFPAEEGREARDRLFASGAVVWPTNSLRLSGGYLTPEVIPHTENFYALDAAPRVVAFCCDRAPWFGGQTAIFDGVGAFSSLPPALRRRLGEPCLVRRLLSLARLRQRHGMRAADVEALARRLDSDATLRPIGTAHPFVTLEMARTIASAVPPPPLAPDAMVSPASDKAGVVAWVRFNFGELDALPSARLALLDGLLSRGLFSGPLWSVHRAMWLLALRHPSSFGMLLRAADALPCWLTRPLSMMRALVSSRGQEKAEAAVDALANEQPPGRSSPRRRDSKSPRRAGKSPPRRAAEPLSDRLSEREAGLIGAALAKHVAVFAWRRGDLLLIDNARVLHDGLPGVGPRRLHVALLQQEQL